LKSYRGLGKAREAVKTWCGFGCEVGEVAQEEGAAHIVGAPGREVIEVCGAGNWEVKPIV